jgi:hypothetical protein
MPKLMTEMPIVSATDLGQSILFGAIMLKPARAYSTQSLFSRALYNFMPCHSSEAPGKTLATGSGEIDESDTCS